MDSSPSPRASRPTLGRNSLTGGSFIDDHQQYKSVHAGPGSSIDGVLEAPFEQPMASLSNLSLSARKSQNPVAIPPSPSLIVRDSGIVHSISHADCIPSLEDPPKLVATIYYNSSSPRHPHLHPDQVFPCLIPMNIPDLPPPTIASGSAPTTNIFNYPLEPPAPEPEPLDHLYGSYISQICLTHFLSTIDSLLAHNSSALRRLTSSHRCLSPSSTQPRIMEVTFSPPPNPEYLTFSDLCKHEAIYRFEREWNCEVILQPATIFRRHKRLCVFDMDSTLIQQEVIDEIAAYTGVQSEVSAITTRAMNGELDFAASLKARVALLKGVPSDVFERLKPKITITPGAKELCKVLKRLGFSLAVLSGGFQPLADWIAGQLGLHHAFANHLLSDPTTNTLTGELDPAHPIVDAEHKKSLLFSLASGRGITLQQTMAVGDGANDIPMLRAAGLGVAWKAKSKVQMEAPARLNAGNSMLDLVYLLGLTEREVEELLVD
jgi:phosphoserine phosphatase